MNKLVFLIVFLLISISHYPSASSLTAPESAGQEISIDFVDLNDQKLQSKQQKSSTTILVHFSFDHYRGPIWKLSNLIYMSNNNLVEHFQQNQDQDHDDQDEHRSKSIHNEIGWQHLLNIDDPNLKNSIKFKSDEVDLPKNDRLDKERLHFLLTCNINSDQNKTIHRLIQNCSLFQVETIIVEKWIKPKFKLLFSMIQNDTLKITNLPDDNETFTELNGKRLRLISVVEEEKKLIVRCMFKKQCLMKRYNQSSFYKFKIVKQDRNYDQNADDQDDDDDDQQESNQINDYNYYEIVDIPKPKQSNNEKILNQYEEFVSKYTAYMLLIIIFIFAIFCFILKQSLVIFEFQRYFS